MRSAKKLLSPEVQGMPIALTSIEHLHFLKVHGFLTNNSITFVSVSFIICPNISSNRGMTKIIIYTVLNSIPYVVIIYKFTAIFFIYFTFKLFVLKIHLLLDFLFVSYGIKLHIHIIIRRKMCASYVGLNA